MQNSGSKLWNNDHDSGQDGLVWLTNKNLNGWNVMLSMLEQHRLQFKKVAHKQKSVSRFSTLARKREKRLQKYAIFQKCLNDFQGWASVGVSFCWRVFTLLLEEAISSRVWMILGWVVVGVSLCWGVFTLARGSNIPPSPQSATNPKLALPLHQRNYGKPFHQRLSGMFWKSNLSIFWQTIPSMFLWVVLENHTINVSLDVLENHLIHVSLGCFGKKTTPSTFLFGWFVKPLYQCFSGLFWKTTPSAFLWNVLVTTPSAFLWMF